MISIIEPTSIAMILVAIAGIPLADIQGQVITLEPVGENTFVSLNVSFSNGTNASLSNELITEEQGNLIVSAVNSVLAGFVEDLEDLELEEELEEIEEEEEEDSNGNENFDNGNGSNDNDNGDNSNGNNSNGNDNGGGENGILLPIPEPIPEPIEPPVEGDAEIRLDLDEDENKDQKEIITEGCADGLGYNKDGPYRCFPIQENGELQTEPPEDTAFCAALGCAFNPVDLP